MKARLGAAQSDGMGHHSRFDREVSRHCQIGAQLIPGVSIFL